MSGNVEAIEQAYEAFLAGDMAGVMTALDPQIEWNVPPSLPFGGRLVGHEAVLGFFGSLGDWFEELHLEPEGLVDAGAQVFVLGRSTFRTAVGSGESQWVHVWDVADGKATRFREYTDTAAVTALLAKERRLDTTGEA